MPEEASATVPPLIASVQHLVKPNGSIVGSEVASLLRPGYPTLLSAIPTAESSSDTCYLAGIDGRRPIQHVQVASFLGDFGTTLRRLGVRRGHRVALVLPNGPELALAILAVSNWAACVPLSAESAASELKADLQRCGADLVIGPYSAGPLPTASATASATADSTNQDEEQQADLKRKYEAFAVLGPSERDWTVHQHVQDTADALNIPYVGLIPDPESAGPFRLWVPPTRRSVQERQAVKEIIYKQLSLLPDRSLIDSSEEGFMMNSGHDEALVLFTSGTTGNKKLVPHRIGDILCAATTIALSWELSTKDVNCNLMPLFHVGGICRQIYAPLISGGSVICCPSFDADLFWGLLQNKAFNWYYAAPTMHSIILQTGKSIFDNDGHKAYQLRMVANAAGGLLPSLAKEIRDTFDAFVLPSYGMTEAMPISSPPSNYGLDRPGTSGVPVGPEVKILNTQTLESLPVGTEGPICVRGEPMFRGYGVLANDPTASRPESFMQDGWFNTGDLGSLDADGFLYITGRSKEVINRGGEIISPMEVEEAVMTHPEVRMCAAFAASHDVLQEMVGIVVVPEPGLRTLDLRALQAFVADKLATPKWPQCLIYMEGGLPKSHTNKLLRVKLAQRLRLPEFTDEMSTWARTFEGQCPPQGTPLTDTIPCATVAVDAGKVQETLRKAVSSDTVWVVPHPDRPGALVAHVGQADVDRLKLIEAAMQSLHRYEVPSHVCMVESSVKNVSMQSLSTKLPKPNEATASILNNADSPGNENDAACDPIVEQLQAIFIELLALDYVPSPDANFFHIGGSSMKASQLASKVRKSFPRVVCSGAEIFHTSSCIKLAELIRSQLDGHSTSDKIGKSSGGGANSQDSTDRDNHGSPFSAIRLQPMGSAGTAIIQLLPLFVIFPCWQILRYLLFFVVLLEKSRFMPDLTDRDMLTFLIAYFVYYLAWITIAPLVFIVFKWIVIGRYKEGRYAIYSSYYLRWWLCDVVRKLVPRGIYGSNYVTLAWYYRMLGANIETGARIGLDCELAEFDLVTVGRYAGVELCTLRGFGVDNGAIMLGKVRVGHGSSVGIRSVVAPFTSVPDGEHLGPVTSSYDATPKKALNGKHARVNRQFFPQPSFFSQFFIGGPLTFFVGAFAQIPPMFVLYSLLWFKSREQTENFFEDWNELMDWLCDPMRIPFFFGIRLARSLFSPFFYMFAALITKWAVIGKIEPGLRSNSEWDTFRIWLAATLFPRKKVQAVTDLIGRHYECVSILYRLLGAKVGKRVFWPGNQPICNGLFDLLEIGDDAVFGSRSTLLCTSIDRYEKIILCAGANVSDNCVVLPGTIVGKNAVLGSNSISQEGSYLPSGSVWFGSKGCEPTCLEAGDGSDATHYQPLTEKNSSSEMISSVGLDTSRLQMIGDETTMRPFGKAFYHGKVKGYRPLGLFAIVLYTWINRIFASFFHTAPLLLAVNLGAVLLYGDHSLGEAFRYYVYDEEYEYDQDDGVNHDRFMGFNRDFDNERHRHNFFDVYPAILTCFMFTHFLRVAGWLVIELTAKWGFMGRRKPGRYNYDTSSYAQRWEMYQLTAKIRKISRLNLLQFITGTPFMNSYIRWNGGTVGRNCCLYPAGADPFMPEPDLVTIGDGCVIDCASIVCHLNTRGNFELAPITIEQNCTLRTRSRVQQGIIMEEGSQLLEKSIAMTGEVIDGRSVWQGGPATLWFRYPDADALYAPPELSERKVTQPSKEGIELGVLS